MTLESDSHAAILAAAFLVRQAISVAAELHDGMAPSSCDIRCRRERSCICWGQDKKFASEEEELDAPLAHRDLLKGRRRLHDESGRHKLWERDVLQQRRVDTFTAIVSDKNKNRPRGHRQAPAKLMN